MQKYNQFSNPLVVIYTFLRTDHFNLVSLGLCLCLIQSGCSQISLDKKSTHKALKEPGLNTGQISTQSSQSDQTIDLTGKWKIGFRLRGKTGIGTMQLQQTNQSFSGSGKDETGAEFKIDHGSIKNNEVIFLKRYETSPSQPVQYHGQFSFISGADGQQLPYIGGDFSLESNGNLVAGDWEASKNIPPQESSQDLQTAPATVESPSPAPEQQADDAKSDQNIASAHSPDLSGKWRMAFEYNFKTIHSTVFLEQDGNKLNGHGIDIESKNKFVIKNGWYHFPKIGFLRQYLDKKPKKHATPIRDMTFKADVTVLSDPDYQGPYLNGKTEGGGNWEAERVD